VVPPGRRGEEHLGYGTACGWASIVVMFVR
jgi:hypothetical protein